MDFDSGRGVFWEGSLINSYLYTGKDNDRFIPILLDDETEDSVPQVMAGWTRYRIRAFGTASHDEGYSGLYRLLTRQPLYDKPETGDIKVLPRETKGIATSEQDGKPAGVPVSAEDAETSRSAKKGLEALISLMNDPKVREEVGRFQAHFQSAAKQIGVLSYYKHLHDQLHTLQLQCYQRLIDLLRDLKDSLEESSAWEKRERVETEMDLQEIHLWEFQRDLEQLADPETILQRGVSWVPKFIDTLKQLSQALKNRDIAQMEKTLRIVGRVLGVEPDRINSSLREAVRALPLVELVASLSRVSDSLDRRQASASAVGSFKEGVAALGKWASSLDALMGQHDRWQTLDVELRRVEAEGLAEIGSSWPDLRKDVQAQLEGIRDEWAPFLAQNAEELTQAIAAREPNRLSRSFRRFRTQVNHWFYETDRRLKDQCEELERIGESFSTVLEVMK